MEYFIQNLKNNIDFFIRKRLGFSRKNYFEANEEKESLFSSAELIEREKILFYKYDLEPLKSNSTRANYLENLYILDILDETFVPEFSENMSVLDIGCKNWFYSKGEYFFFKKYCQDLKLDGIEIDSNRLYTNFYTRVEVAKFYIKGLVGATYIPGDFLEHNVEYDFMIWILPFIFEYPHIKWGLPQKYFMPKKMLEHAYNSLNQDGKILIINQGKVEYNAQKSLCEKLDINYYELGEIKSEFQTYKIQRYGIVIQKK